MIAVVYGQWTTRGSITLDENTTLREVLERVNMLDLFPICSLLVGGEIVKEPDLARCISDFSILNGRLYVVFIPPTAVHYERNANGEWEWVYHGG